MDAGGIIPRKSAALSWQQVLNFPFHGFPLLHFLLKKVNIQLKQICSYLRGGMSWTGELWSEFLYLRWEQIVLRCLSFFNLLVSYGMGKPTSEEWLNLIQSLPLHSNGQLLVGKEVDSNYHKFTSNLVEQKFLHLTLNHDLYTMLFDNINFKIKILYKFKGIS